MQIWESLIFRCFETPNINKISQRKHIEKKAEAKAWDGYHFPSRVPKLGQIPQGQGRVL
jgi:hypothetical protein